MSKAFDQYLKKKKHKEAYYKEKAKGKAELKTRHLKKLEKSIKEDILSKNGTKLELIYEFSYRENLESLIGTESKLLKAIAKGI